MTGLKVVPKTRAYKGISRGLYEDLWSVFYKVGWR